MKRNGGILIFLTVFLSSLTTAGPVEGLYQLTEGAREMIIIITGFISDIDSFDEFLFAKLLLFTLILLVVYTVIKKNTVFKGNKAIQFIVSISIATLSIKFLPDSFVEAILLQYGALAVGLTVFLPLTIYFFFIHQSELGPFGRKAGWIVFATSFFALWRFRYEDLGSINWIYWTGVGFIALSLVFDRRIHKYFGMSSVRLILRKSKEDQHRRHKRKLFELENDYKDNIITKQQYDRERPIIEKRIKDTAP